MGKHSKNSLFSNPDNSFDSHPGVAGVDEVGRGPLAGPVVAAAVILPENHGIEGIGDSKTLSPLRREKLDVLIRERALAVAIGLADRQEIDQINILQASLLAMARAIQGLGIEPQRVLVDGREKIPDLAMPQEAIIGGDRRVEVIGAASIVAKVYRDRWMVDADKKWPGYGFAKHKGYPSKAHRQAIEALGPCPLHRTTFRGVREFLDRSRVG